MGKTYNARKRKVKKNVPHGCVHIHTTFNNTVITITDIEGNTISWASAGTMGVKGSKKSTPFAAGMAAEKAGKAAVDSGMKTVRCWKRISRKIISNSWLRSKINHRCNTNST